MDRIVGIDLGTQSLKVVLYCPSDHQIKAVVSEQLPLISYSDGTREQKSEWYAEALRRAFEQIPQEEKSLIKAIGVSGQQHGFVPLDENGSPVYNVKLWNDTTTVKECEEIVLKVGGDDRVISLIQNHMLPGYTAPKILWLKKNKPNEYRSLKYIMLPHNFINYLLTDEYKMEPGDASGTALYNIIEKRWSRELCDAIDERLVHILPEVINSRDICGYTTKKACALYGVPEGVPVSSGGGDNMMGAIGTGCVKDGDLTVSLGTSGTLYGYSSKPIYDPARGVAGFLSSTGGYLPLICTMNCTVATEQIRTMFGMSLDELNECARNSPPGSDGIVILPFFNGERTPNLPRAKASIMGMTTNNFNKENLSRASMESALYGIRAGLDVLVELGFKAETITLIGGGSHSRLWRQITADILGVPVKTLMNPEAAALGAAFQALWAIDQQKRDIADIVNEHVQYSQNTVVYPDQESQKEYKKTYERYLAYISSLIQLYD